VVEDNPEGVVTIVVVNGDCIPNLGSGFCHDVVVVPSGAFVVTDPSDANVVEVINPYASISEKTCSPIGFCEIL
jgi:hypothetical protein